jgi:hypothetical protein
MPPVRMVGARGCACHEYREWLDRGIRSIACMPIYVAKPLYRIPQRGFGRDVFGDLCSRFLAHTVGKKTVPMFGCFGKTNLA